MDSTTQVRSYPIAELFNQPGKQGLLGVGRSKYYEAQSALRIEPFLVDRQKHVTLDQKDLLALYLSKSSKEQSQMLAELFSDTSTDIHGRAIAPSQPASMVVQQPDVMAAFMQAIQAQKQSSPIQELRDRLMLLMDCAKNERPLPTSELAMLLDVPRTTISGKKVFRKYGFTCTNLGREGRESSWKIE